MTQAAVGRRAVAGRTGPPYTDPVRLRLPAALLSIFVSAANPAYAQTQRLYIPLETDDAFVYMDERGVAVRAEKNFACRNVGWAPTADPKVLSNAKFVEFRQGQIDRGTWDQWICRAVMGPIVFSRGILEAQRKLNMAPNEPSCTLWVPETGRLNWEMLEFDRCALSTQLAAVKASAAREFAARLADLTGTELPEDRLQSDPAQVLEELLPRARAERLDIFAADCGRVVSTVLDLVTCQRRVRQEQLDAAEGLYGAYASRVESLRGTASLEQGTVDGLAADAAEIRRRLREALDE